MTEKIDDYSEIAVPEISVVSSESSTVKVLILIEGWLKSARILSSGILTPKLFPNVQLDIPQIWPD